VWRVYDRRDVLDWVVVTTYAWFFLALSLIQVRFAGELAPFVSIFAGYGVVWLARRAIEAVSRRTQGVASIADSLPVLGSTPSARVAVVVVVLLVPVFAVGATTTTTVMNSPIYTEDVSETAAFLADHSAGAGADVNGAYVLSRWPHNRLYNYFVSGSSFSFNYSQETYRLFGVDTRAEDAYEFTHEGVDYLVLDHRQHFPNITNARENNLGLRLARTGGSATPEWAGTGHYRLLYVSPNTTHSVYEPVTGAVLTGSAPPNATVLAGTNVTVPNADFIYTRPTEASADGEFSLRVSYSGPYLVRVANETRAVMVTESDVHNGTRLTVEG